MSDNISENIVMDLDLNQEPLDPPPSSSLLGLGSLLNDLETTHSRIEDRIRQLEAVTARARLRQRWRQSRNPNPNETIDLSIEPIESLQIENVENGGLEREDNLGFPQESNRIVGYKRDSSHLVAKALELDSEVKKAASSNSGGSFYDCNICLEIAREPILTCCGHLFCWACFYQLSYVDSSSKECPVCKGEVTDSSITPIYGGNGNDTRVSESELGLKIPPRPRANRIESIRSRMQSRMQNGFSPIPVAEALRRIRNIGVGAVSGGVAVVEPPEVEAGGSRRFRSRQFSRVLSESAASLSSISSALNNAERLVEDLETYIHDRLSRRNDVARFRNPFSSNAAAAPVNSGSLTVDSTSEVNSVAIPPLSSRRSDVSAEIVHLENVTDNAAADTDTAAARAPRRRRLR